MFDWMIDVICEENPNGKIIQHFNGTQKRRSHKKTTQTARASEEVDDTIRLHACRWCEKFILKINDQTAECDTEKYYRKSIGNRRLDESQIQIEILF